MLYSIFITILILLTGGFIWYILGGRDTLKQMPSAQWWFQFWEPIEILLWRKSETILKARLLMFSGAALTLLTQMGEIDLSPFMPFVPDKYYPFVAFAINSIPLLLTFMGMIDEKLRRETTKPLELVAIREEDVPADVRAAIIAAEKAKEVAVAVVVEAKVEERVQA